MIRVDAMMKILTNAIDAYLMHRALKFWSKIVACQKENTRNDRFFYLQIFIFITVLKFITSNEEMQISYQVEFIQ